MSHAAEIAAAHDQMAAEYDDLDDLYYSWLFARIHELVATSLPSRKIGEGRAVDAGCGTGFQSFLLAQAGYDVLGFDLAGDLLAKARLKSPRFSVPPRESPPLFRTKLRAPWIAAHHRRLASLLETRRGGDPVRPPRFVTADLCDFDFGHEELDVVTCCGSVLSFVDDHRRVLERMVKGLRRGGRLILEVEQKANMDLLWPIADRLLHDRLGFEQTWTEIFDNLAAWGRSVRIDYPFELHGGAEVVLPLRLFSVGDLEAGIRASGARIVRRLGVHHVTNLLPSPVLHRSDASPTLRTAFEILRRVEEKAGARWPFWRLGCSVIYCLER